MILVSIVVVATAVFAVVVAFVALYCYKKNKKSTVTSSKVCYVNSASEPDESRVAFNKVRCFDIGYMYLIFIFLCLKLYIIQPPKFYPINISAFMVKFYHTIFLVNPVANAFETS